MACPKQTRKANGFEIMNAHDFGKKNVDNWKINSI